MKRFVWALVFLLTACADDAPPAQVDRWSGDPQADLKRLWNRKTFRDDVAAWPFDRASYRRAPATRVVLTESLLELLSGEAPDVLTAFDRYELLRVRFGDGRTREGKPIAIDVLRAAVVEGALDAARRLVSGDRPDQDKALEVLGVARRLQADDDEARLERATRWVAAQDLPSLMPEEIPAALSEHEGPRVLVFTDHFTLGEARIRAVLERWAKRGRLQVHLIPVWRGNVRVGMRRVPATRDEEREALRDAAASIGLQFEEALGEPPWGTWLDLGRSASAVVVLNDEGVIAGRMMGTFPALQALEGTVQRVTGR